MDPDRRYQVFISSTFSDLSNQRKEAIAAVYEAGHIPIALENFPPTSAGNIQVIRRAMEQCQIFVLILGHRYGKLLPDGSMSYTEYEYDLAQEYKLHTLIFALDEGLAQEKRRQLDETKDDERLEREHFPMLQRFIARVRTHFLSYWHPEDFKYKVGISLARELTQCGLPGFIREPDDPTLFDSQSEFIVDIVSKLKSFTKLYERCKKNPTVKRELSGFFVEQYMDTIGRSQVDLFFESGSTLAFLAKEMAEHLKGRVVISDGVPNVAITTNNVLAYLLLWLSARIPCSQFPWSPPFESTYGALYAGIANLKEKHPDYRQPSLDQHAMMEIEKLRTSHFAPRRDEHRVTLLLGTSSGLQLNKPRKINFHPDVSAERRAVVGAQIEACFGPHVGSYHNKVFKRFMYATGLPLVLFFDGEKIDSEVEAGKCHYILDKHFTWEHFLSTHPVAFCIGCGEPQEAGETSKAELTSYFRNRGFAIIDESGGSSVGSFIARNTAFIEQFEVRCKMLSRQSD
jgi:hypothetical protein